MVGTPLRGEKNLSRGPLRRILLNQTDRGPLGKVKKKCTKRPKVKVINRVRNSQSFFSKKFFSTT
jgi:hypothetical protein